jgi:hypothetical protein
MAKTPEAKVKDKIKALCKTYGAYYAQPIGMGMASNGTPDFLLCHRGHFAGVEAKAGKGTYTALQMVRLEEILAAGGAAFIINEANMKRLEQWLIDPPRYGSSNLNDWR